MATTGRCLCGHIRYRFSGAPLWVAHCHCESCRRQTSSAVATFVGVQKDQLTYTSATPSSYRSSPGVERLFCPKCGAPIAYENAASYPNETHLYLGTLDDPNAVRATQHVFVAEQLSWFEIDDDLPRYATSASGSEPMHGPRHRSQKR